MSQIVTVTRYRAVSRESGKVLGFFLAATDDAVCRAGFQSPEHWGELCDLVPEESWSEDVSLLRREERRRLGLPG